jgi:pimeloyl-ACP methyl ester carboxylesterase
MPGIWKSEAGKAAVLERYRALIAQWPGGAEEIRIPTREGETFVMASGPRDAPPLLLLHGSGSNTAMWMGDAPVFATGFRVYAVDMIGEPGFSAPSRPPLEGEGHALWLDDVLAGLGVERASIVGLSLGGWLALDYAIRRPGKVERLVLVTPGGIGRNVNILAWALPLLLLGPFGRRRLIARIVGPVEKTPEFYIFSEFMAIIFKSFRTRMEPLPIASDDALSGLDIPILGVLGGRDELIDSEGVRRRLQTLAPRAEVLWLPDAGHVIPGHAEPILEFLQRRGG